MSTTNNTNGESSTKTFSLLFRVKKPDHPLKQEELPDGWGAADAVVVTSVVKEPDGSEDFAIVSWDGELNNPVTTEDLFKYWLVWAEFLKGTLPPDDPRGTLCQIVSTTAAKYADEFEKVIVTHNKPSN